MPRFKIGFPWTLGETIESILETVIIYALTGIVWALLMVVAFFCWLIYMIFLSIAYLWIEIDSIVYRIKNAKTLATD